MHTSTTGCQLLPPLGGALIATPLRLWCRRAGLDQDQFIRLLREPGQQWTVWDIWETEANGGDGLFPTEEELAQLDGIVISGDRYGRMSKLWLLHPAAVAPAAAAALVVTGSLWLLPLPLPSMLSPMLDSALDPHPPPARGCPTALSLQRLALASCAVHAAGAHR